MRLVVSFVLVVVVVNIIEIISENQFGLVFPKTRDKMVFTYYYSFVAIF